MTQAAVAQRLGLKGVYGNRYVSHLEKGEVPNPSFLTIVRFLHVCGARFTALSDLVDKLEPLPEDPNLKAVVAEYKKDVRGRSGYVSLKDDRSGQKILVKADADATKAQRHAAYPVAGPPPETDKARAGAIKQREYYVQLGVIRDDVMSYVHAQGELPMMDV